MGWCEPTHCFRERGTYATTGGAGRRYSSVKSNTKGLVMMKKSILSDAQLKAAAKMLREDPTLGRVALGRYLKCSVRQSAAVIKKFHADNPGVLRISGRSLADFAKQYDRGEIIHGKIREALSLLGRDGWRYELELSQLAGISTLELSKARETFADHIVKVHHGNRNVWAGTVKTAEKMRDILRGKDL